MGDKQSSTSTSIPNMGGQETALMDMITGSMIPAYMEKAGYEVTPTKIDSFKDSAEYKKWSAKIASADKAIAAAKAAGGIYTRKDGTKVSLAELQIARDSQVDALEKAQRAFKPYYDYETRKLGTPAEEAIRAKYGEDSPEYKKIKAETLTATIETEKQKEEIGKLYMDKVQKYMSGDFSITEEQKQYVAEQFAPIKTAIDEMYTGRFDELEERYKDFNDQVSETSMKVGDALAAVGEQIQKTGKDMKTVLDSTIQTSKELLKMGIYDATGKITKDISQKAIASGRDPSDPEYSQEIQTSVAREIKYGTLNLAEMQTRGEMSIAERTGSGMEEIQRAMARLAEREGSLRENAVLSKGQEKAGLISGKGEALTRLEESKANVKQNIGMGMVPGQISVGSGYMSMDQALAAQRLANASAPFGVVSGVAGTYHQDRLAQPTTTQTTPFDYMGTALGLGSAGMGMYTGFAEAGANDAMASWYNKRSA